MTDSDYEIEKAMRDMAWAWWVLTNIFIGCGVVVLLFCAGLVWVVQSIWGWGPAATLAVALAMLLLILWDQI